MKIPQRAIAYLNNTLYDSWSFPDVVNLIKEELLLNREESFSVLDRILKTDFKGVARANEWINQWKSLSKQYEKTKETRTGTNEDLFSFHLCIQLDDRSTQFNVYIIPEPAEWFPYRKSCI